mmetsp:Transcript_158879/g.509474  ORF Transcript_158879/g.509474 Transcript_158879/m.509474 type:complete len:201 (-) Transcript_158879:4998-5600(-)
MHLPFLPVPEAAASPPFHINCHVILQGCCTQSRPNCNDTSSSLVSAPTAALSVALMAACLASRSPLSNDDAFENVERAVANRLSSQPKKGLDNPTSVTPRDEATSAGHAERILPSAARAFFVRAPSASVVGSLGFALSCSASDSSTTRSSLPPGSATASNQGKSEDPSAAPESSGSAASKQRGGNCTSNTFRADANWFNA